MVTKLKVATLQAHATDNTARQELDVFEHIEPGASSPYFTVADAGIKFTTLRYALSWAALEIYDCLEGK